jgi:hypothetical protein
MNEEGFGVYHRRAIQLADAMKLCQDDLPSYGSAAALLAVHSAISYSDAVLIGLGRSRPRGENHSQAIAAPRRACASFRIDHRGIAHFQSLIGAKTDISYGGRSIDNERVRAFCVAAERFQVWAERILDGKKGKRNGN